MTPIPLSGTAIKYEGHPIHMPPLYHISNVLEAINNLRGLTTAASYCVFTWQGPVNLAVAEASANGTVQSTWPSRATDEAETQPRPDVCLSTEEWCIKVLYRIAQKTSIIILLKAAMIIFPSTVAKLPCTHSTRLGQRGGYIVHHAHTRWNQTICDYTLPSVPSVHARKVFYDETRWN